MTSYYTLVTSLPRHNRQFKIKETPISRIQLENRLKQLTQHELNTLLSLEQVVFCSWFNSSLSFKDTMMQAKKLLAAHDPFMDDIIHQYFDLRSVLVVLRLRHAKQPAPTNTRDLWLTRWNRVLLTHWNEADFGLKNTYPWLPDANMRLSHNEPDVLEQTLLTQLWKYLDQLENRHYFDFEAVIIYLLRWNIVNYWSQFNKATAIKRFNHISNSILKMIETEF